MNYNHYIIDLCLEGQYSVIPVHDGGKNPHQILGSGHTLLETSASPEDIKTWLDAGVKSFALAGGKVSNNLLCLDFDEKYQEGLFEIWYSTLQPELKEIIDQGYKVRTRNNGTHIWIKTESPQPTKKYAEIISGNNKLCVIETRGENSYALIPPSDGYVRISGDLLNLPTVSNEKYLHILNSFKPFNQIGKYEEDEISINYKSDNIQQNTPWSWMENNVTFDELLEPAGWTKYGTNYWIRPDKKGGGISATTNYNGLPIFYCFSSNAHPFEANKGYSKFSVYALLRYGGDIKLAVKNLATDYPKYAEEKVLTVSDEFELDKYKPISWSQVDSWEFPEASWWIEDLIPKNAFVIIASISGEGKSWSAYTMAKNIAEGENFLGQHNFKTNKGTVLYIDAENSPKEIQRRCRKLGYRDNNKLLFLPVSDFNINNKVIADKLKDIIHKNKIDLVIVDTFRAVAGGLDENQANTVRQFFNQFKANRDNGTSFVFLDHYRKPNHFEGKVPRKEFLFGSQDKTAGVEILLMLKKDEDTIEVHQVKNRVGKEISPFAMKLVDEKSSDGKDITYLKYASEIDPEMTKKDTARIAIINLLNDESMTRQELVNILGEEELIGEKNVDLALKVLVADKLIKKVRNGKKDFYNLIKVGPNSVETDL